MDRLGQIEILTPDCNIATVQDGRGGIFNWNPDDDIKEWVMLNFFPNKVRGNHYHPEFDEYFLVVSGLVVLVTKDADSGKELNRLMGPGSCWKSPKFVPHAIHAIKESICMAFLTKRWDECKDPIIFEDLIPFDKEYLKYKNSEK
jgi:mannose-6-phosphate isomerase-like protein (cupin superfamily)